jgi:hypothetical protein
MRRPRRELAEKSDAGDRPARFVSPDRLKAAGWQDALRAEHVQGWPRARGLTLRVTDDWSAALSRASRAASMVTGPIQHNELSRPKTRRRSTS